MWGKIRPLFLIYFVFQAILSQFLPAATARWSISAVSTSAQRTIEHDSIETNELNMTLMSH